MGSSPEVPLPAIALRQSSVYQSLRSAAASNGGHCIELHSFAREADRMRQLSQWLQWLHSAFARLRSRSLAALEVAANEMFQRTRANGRERPPAFAMQKVVGSSPIIRSRNACNWEMPSSDWETMVAAWLHSLTKSV
jgi:hypothetical protein